MAAMLLLCACDTVAVQGERGDDGAPGASGEQGPAGAPGAPGARGERGSDGTPGTASLCALTEPTTGDLGGYEGAKALCEDTCSSEHARMCTGHDVAVLRQLGEIPVAIWYARGGNDCASYHSSSPDLTGPSSFSEAPSCDSTIQVACCD